MRSQLCSPVLEKLPQEKGISLQQCFLTFPYTHNVRSFYRTRKKHGSIYFSTCGQAYSKHKNKDQIHSGQKFKTQWFLKNRNRDFQFLVLHVRSLEVAVLSKQVKIWTNWKIHKSSWIHNREEDTGQTAAPKIGETDRLIVQRATAYRNRDEQLHHGNQGCGRNIWTVTDEFLKTQCRPAWELKTPGGPRLRGGRHFFGARPGSHSRYPRRIS